MCPNRESEAVEFVSPDQPSFVCIAIIAAIGQDDMVQYPNIHQLRRLLDTLGQGIVVRTGAEATGWMIMA